MPLSLKRLDVHLYHRTRRHIPEDISRLAGVGIYDLTETVSSEQEFG